MVSRYESGSEELSSETTPNPNTEKVMTITTTTTRQAKAATIRREIEISEPAPSGLILASVTEIHNAGQKITVDLYWIRRQASDFGLAFAVEKGLDGTVYDVLLNAPGGGHSCDCAHGCYGSHRKNCRHVECCLQAIREQKI